MLAEVLEYFGQGYAVYVEDCYGGYECVDVEEIQYAWPDENDSFHHVESVKVYELLHEVHFFVSNDK